MEELLTSVGIKNILVIGVLVFSFTECAKAFLPDEIENKIIMALAQVLGLGFAYLGYLVKMFTDIPTALITGVLAAGIVSGAVKFVLDLIKKKSA